MEERFELGGADYQTSEAKTRYAAYWPLSIPHLKIKVPLWMGEYAARESGLEAYLEKSGWEFNTEKDGTRFCRHPDDELSYMMFCFAIGNSAFVEENDIDRCLKAEAMGTIEPFLEENKERAPELKEYIDGAIRFGKENKKDALEHAVKVASKTRWLDKISDLDEQKSEIERS